MRDDAGTKPIALITGATDGIGRALAHEFARDRHDLMLVARSEKSLSETCAELERLYAISARHVAADLATRQGCDAVADAVARHGLWVEYLVNDAGIGIVGPFEKNDHDKLMQLVDLNIRALTDLTRRFLPGMIERKRGGVLNLASLGGFAPGAYMAAYYASKAYVLSLTQAIAYETRDSGLRVSALAPGVVETSFHTRAGAGLAHYRHVGAMSAEDVARIGYKGFMARKRVIVPGFANKLARFGLSNTPRVLLLPFSAWLFKRRGRRSGYLS